MNGFQMNLQQPQVAYHYLLRLRWLSVAGQLLICLVSVWFLRLGLPLVFLGGAIFLAALTNVFAGFFRNRLLRYPTLICFSLIVLDTLILTAMLYRTGGANNPFSAVYLLHVTLGAILLPVWGPWVILGICGLGFWALFGSPYELSGSGGIIDWGEMATHLQGMLLSMVIAGAGIAYFVSRLSASLGRHQAELERVRAQAVRQEHFASLATLSAGLAHELATPLGTIAVVSRDMEIHVPEAVEGVDFLEDVRLIRSEVDRCREILDRIGNEVLNMEGTRVERVSLADPAALLRPYLSGDHFRRVRFEVVPENLEICVPETPLLQSLAVVLKNACEAGPGLPVDFSVEVLGDEVCFVVEDRGAGMEPEVVARLGEPFFTTKEPGFGMGLGLFVVRTFVDRMKGRLEVDSAVGEGTVLRLCFPCLREESDE